MTISITVSGSASGNYPPERARVSLTVTAADPDRAVAADRVAGVHTRLRDELHALDGRGALSNWSSGTITSYSYRPRDDRGREQAPVQVARVAVSATFSDFDALSPAVDGWLRESLIGLGGIEWSLTDEHHSERAAQVRRNAVDNAIEKAQSYADALNAGPVEPVEIADCGMLPGVPGSGGGPMPARAVAMYSAAADDGEATVDLRPQDITLEMSVEARFTAAR